MSPHTLRVGTRTGGLPDCLFIPLGIVVAGGHVPDPRDLGDGNVPGTLNFMVTGTCPEFPQPWYRASTSPVFFGFGAYLHGVFVDDVPE